jgi:hypothetical protein
MRTVHPFQAGVSSTPYLTTLKHKEKNQMDDSMAYLIPIAPFVMISIIGFVALQTWSRYRTAQQETLRMAIQSGQKLDETTLKLLAKTPLMPEMDLRQGIISMCLAVGFGLAAALSTQMPKNGDLATVIGMVAILIGSVGVGQVIAWKARTMIAKSAPSEQD